MRALRPVTLAAALLACLLGACATLAPGEDANGIEARDAARPVLAALVQFQKDHHEWPSSLYELAPKYIKAVPFNPGLRYDRDDKVIEFAYLPSWPAQDPVNCGAKLGELDWTCVKP